MATSIRKSDYDSLKRIFEPRRVAVIGVSSDGFGFGRGILLSLIKIGFQGELYPVNPRGGTTSGLAMYARVEDIPGGFDLGIIAVPAHQVPSSVEACLKKGAAGVEILSAGFRETGTPEGIELERTLAGLSSRGIRIIGPNCFGVYNPRSGLTVLPGPDLSREPGPVGFISQSGGITVDLAHVGKWRGIGFSTMVSFGNGVDLRETELLNYFERDPDTGIIGMYLEGLDDGRRFFDALKSTCLNKPVVICKGGLSEFGSRAAMSHTASIAGSSEIWRAMVHQCNAIEALDMRDLSNYLLAFATLPVKRYRGISIIGGGGAIGVAGADTAAACGMEIPELAPNLQEQILAVLPRPGSSARNPIDVANPFVSPEALKTILLRAAGTERIDAQIVVQLLYHYKSIAVHIPGTRVRDITPIAGFADAFSQASSETGKPVIVVLPDYKQEPEALDIAETIRTARKLYTGKGIPVYDDIRDAIQSLKVVSDYSIRRDSR